MRPHFTDFVTHWNIHSENFPSCRNDGWKRFAGFQFNNNQTLFAFLHPQLCIRFRERKVWVRLKEKLFSWKLLLSGRHLPFWHKILLETKHLSIPISKVKYLQQQQMETLFSLVFSMILFDFTWQVITNHIFFTFWNYIKRWSG